MGSRWEGRAARDHPKHRLRGKWGPNVWAPGNTRKGRRGPLADWSTEAQLPVCLSVAIATARSALPRSLPPTSAGSALRRNARGHSPRPSGGLAPNWRAHSALVVAKSGIPHLEKLFGRRGSLTEVDGGRVGTKRVGLARSTSPRGGAGEEGSPRCVRRRSREQLFLAMDLRSLSRGQRSRPVTLSNSHITLLRWRPG